MAALGDPAMEVGMRRSKFLPVPVVIDTKEQEPYTFNPNLVVPVRRALPAGDYSIAGLENMVAVERKTVNDFVNTVIHSRTRFYRELASLRKYKLACVVVEGTLADVLGGKYTGHAKPESVFSTAIAITVNFGIPVFYCSNRQAACRFVETYLLRAAARRASWPPGR
jgi:ERCC4-type nuclease